MNQSSMQQRATVGGGKMMQGARFIEQRHRQSRQAPFMLDAAKLALGPAEKGIRLEVGWRSPVDGDHVHASDLLVG